MLTNVTTSSATLLKRKECEDLGNGVARVNIAIGDIELPRNTKCGWIAKIHYVLALGALSLTPFLFLTVS